MVGFGVETSLIALADNFILCTLLYGIKLLVLLEFIEGLALLLNHVTVSEREVIDLLDRLQLQLV